MSTTQTNIQEPDASIGTVEEAEACRILACLMSGIPVELPENGCLREPLGGIIREVAPLPLDARLEAMGNALARRFSGPDADALVTHIIGLNPRETGPASPIPFPFPVPTTLVDQKPEIETSGGYETITLGDLLAMEDKGIDWLVEDLLPVNGVGILGGHAGKGKSWMTMDLALAIIEGRPWLGRFPTKKGRVLYVDEESGIKLLRHRLGKLANAIGKRLPEGELHLVVQKGLCLINKDSLETLRRTIAATKPILVIIDSLIRVHGSEENSASEMAKVFSEIKRIVNDFDCAVLFADHHKKPGVGGVSQDQMLRGTTEKVAFVDTLLSLSKKDKALVVEHSKSRYAPPVPSFVIEIVDQGSDRTVVRVVGDAEEIRQQARKDLAGELLSRMLADGDWKSRPDLTEAAKSAGVPVKDVDALLRAWTKAGKLEREDRKLEGGRGNKTAYYRLNPVANSVSNFQSTRVEGNGNGNEMAPEGSSGDLWLGAEEGS